MSGLCAGVRARMCTRTPTWPCSMTGRKQSLTMAAQLRLCPRPRSDQRADWREAALWESKGNNQPQLRSSHCFTSSLSLLLNAGPGWGAQKWRTRAVGSRGGMTSQRLLARKDLSQPRGFKLGLSRYYIFTADTEPIFQPKKYFRVKKAT